MYRKYLERAEFDSYEDFAKNLKIVAPQSYNFAFDVVDAYADEQPGKLALIWVNDSGEERRFTFADIKSASNRAANFLAGLGIKKGDYVMLILKRRHEYWPIMMALHKLGAITIPATHLLTAKDIEYRNNAADIKMIISVGDDLVADSVDKAHGNSRSLERKVMLGKSRPGWLNYEDGVRDMPDTFARPEGAAAAGLSDPMLMYFTSGTTGMPKMVQHNYEYSLAHMLTAKYWQNVGEGEPHLTLSDSGWGKFVWGKLYGQWLCGAVVFAYDMEKFVPSKILELIEKYDVATFCAPPTMYRFLIKEDLTKYKFRKLRYCTIAGEPLNPEVYYQFLKATGIKLHEGFGQTETVLQIANYIWTEPKPASMGKPSPLYDIEIVDERGAVCDPGVKGEITIKLRPGGNSGLFSGYYRDPELTAAAIRDGVYHTGDMAWADEDGHIWFDGRTDDVIKSSGYRIGPFEVESAILTHPAVLECAVTAVPHPDRGQIVKATVVLAKGRVPSDELAAELQEHVKKVTAPYKYPRIVEFVDELPKTISGKIRRGQIRESDLNRGAGK
ncbi:MAG: AMP-binding protein [Clostridiales bacterium]|jgi:acetyl-CoA synthetase|nr:AMP-binding protein [Clostridiales bacterium]